MLANDTNNVIEFNDSFEKEITNEKKEVLGIIKK